VCVCAFTLTISAQVSISLDQATLYQTIEGFGYEPNYLPWKVRSGPFMVDVDPDTTGVYDSSITELGATMIRSRPLPEYQADSGVFDCSALQGKGGWFSLLRRLQAVAERENEPLRLLGQVWSPPGWMKVGGQAKCEGLTEDECMLKVGYEDDFGHHLTSFAQMIHDSTDLEYYAISIQDEPAWDQQWESCVYTPTRYRETLKGVVSVFREVGLQTRFFGAEHAGWAFGTYERAIRQDPQALAYMHAWATHGYNPNNHSLRPDTGSYAGSTPTQKPYWQTTGSTELDSVNDWVNGLGQADTLWHFLRVGKGSAWTWFVLLANSSGSEFSRYGLISDGKHNAAYYASCHYFRYIRPGARQIESSSDDDSVRVVAFLHEQNHCVTVVLVNIASSEKTVNGLTGSGTPSRFERIVSTADTKLARDSVDASADIALPPKSVTTLVSGAYRNTGTTSLISSLQPLSRGSAAPRCSPEPLRVYSLDGRLMGSRGAAPAARVYILRTPNGLRRGMRIAAPAIH